MYCFERVLYCNRKSNNKKAYYFKKQIELTRKKLNKLK